MAKPNYAFAKRQRDIAKKKKKEDKKQLKKEAQQLDQQQTTDEPVQIQTGEDHPE
ncbi:MAG: hypothetical protein OEY43_09675 [Gammaproteobacteria bacterium]|nr:hypothetical protein [Gammaproteobacteria bacterium]